MSEFSLDQFFNYYVDVNSNTEFAFEDNTSQVYPVSAERRLINTQQQYKPMNMYESIVLKKEFGTLQANRIEAKPTRGSFLPHQQFVARFLSPYTPYDRMLVFHGIGTGKTAVWVNLAYETKRIDPSKKIYIILRSDLLIKTAITQIAQELTNIGDTQLNYNNYKVWREKRMLEDIDLSDTTRFKSFKAWVQTETDKIVKQTFKFMTYYDLYKEIEDKKNNPVVFQSMFDNSLVIMDEAHNLKPTAEKVVKSKKVDQQAAEEAQRSQKVYAEIFWMTQHVKNCKIVLLTATPMIDQPNELIYLLNLLLTPGQSIIPLNHFRTNFFDTHLTTEDKNRNMNKFIEQYLAGKVSYIRSAITVDVQHVGQQGRFLIEQQDQDEAMNRLQTTIVQAYTMSSYQTELYAKAYMKDKNAQPEGSQTGSQSAYWAASRQASLCVYPQGADEAKEPLWGRNEPGQTRFLTELRRSTNKLATLQKYSTKFHAIIEYLLANPTNKVFVYSELITGSGLNLFAAVLKEFGFSQFLNQNATQQKDRYMLITSETVDTAEGLIKVFNNPDINLRGQVCRVILASIVASEGVTFKHCRRVFLLTPNWNESTTIQTLGRCIRSFAHDDLPAEDRNIQVDRMAAVPSYQPAEATIRIQSVDLRFYAYSEGKDREIKLIEHLLKTSAVDCALNRRRNILPEQFDESSDCDYMRCDYECYNVREELYNYRGPYFSDTFNLNYAHELEQDILDQLKVLFMIKSAYTFDEMTKKLQRRLKLTQPLNGIILAKSLHQIISRNVAIINRHGFINYLKTEGQMYFLVDSALGGHNYSLNFYADKPYPDTSTYDYNGLEDSLDLQLTRLRNERTQDIIDNVLEADDLTKEQLDACFSLMDKTSANQIRQECINQAITLSDQITTQQPFLQKVYEFYVEQQPMIAMTNEERYAWLRRLWNNPFNMYGMDIDKKFNIKLIQHPGLTSGSDYKCIDLRGRLADGQDSGSINATLLILMFLNVYATMTILQPVLQSVSTGERSLPPFYLDALEHKSFMDEALELSLYQVATNIITKKTLWGLKEKDQLRDSETYKKLVSMYTFIQGSKFLDQQLEPAYTSNDREIVFRQLIDAAVQYNSTLSNQKPVKDVLDVKNEKQKTYLFNQNSQLSAKYYLLQQPIIEQYIQHILQLGDTNTIFFKCILACMGINEDLNVQELFNFESFRPMQSVLWNELNVLYWGKVDATDEPKNKTLVSLYYLASEVTDSRKMKADLTSELYKWFEKTNFISEGEHISLMWKTDKNQSDQLHAYITQLKTTCEAEVKAAKPKPSKKK